MPTHPETLVGEAIAVLATVTSFAEALPEGPGLAFATVSGRTG